MRGKSSTGFGVLDAVCFCFSFFSAFLSWVRCSFALRVNRGYGRQTGGRAVTCTRLRTVDVWMCGLLVGNAAVQGRVAVDATRAVSFARRRGPVFPAGRVNPSRLMGDRVGCFIMGSSAVVDEEEEVLFCCSALPACLLLLQPALDLHGLPHCCTPGSGVVADLRGAGDGAAKRGARTRRLPHHSTRFPFPS